MHRCSPKTNSREEEKKNHISERKEIAAKPKVPGDEGGKQAVGEQLSSARWPELAGTVTREGTAPGAQVRPSPPHPRIASLSRRLPWSQAGATAATTSIKLHQNGDGVGGTIVPELIPQPAGDHRVPTRSHLPVLGGRWEVLTLTRLQMPRTSRWTWGDAVSSKAALRKTPACPSPRVARTGMRAPEGYFPNVLLLPGPVDVLLYRSHRQRHECWREHILEVRSPSAQTFGFHPLAPRPLTHP